MDKLMARSQRRTKDTQLRHSVQMTEKLSSGAASQSEKNGFYESVSNTPVSNNYINIEDEEEKEEESAQDDIPKKQEAKDKQKLKPSSIILAQISETLYEPPPTISLPFNSSNERRRFLNDDFFATSSISKISGDN
ncbi:hypothetical protein G5I_14592 [Acromyrmex echinatior]|uniref:Uncharacterized protein n=1 Tax=Acromyrmex echinatior TaxID=103372 RepID=F4X853_ACREC|nr:hypothetical protein G5I_14592 [Acromyrmex echinatior]